MGGGNMQAVNKVNKRRRARNARKVLLRQWLRQNSSRVFFDRMHEWAWQRGALRAAKTHIVHKRIFRFSPEVAERLSLRAKAERGSFWSVVHALSGGPSGDGTGTG